MSPERAMKPETISCTEEINGIATDLVVSFFHDRIFIVTTQLGTFGTVVEAVPRHSIAGKFQPEIHVRLGRRDDPLLLVYARQFLEKFGLPLGLPVVAAIGLKDRSSATFEAVMNALQKLWIQKQTP